MGVPAAMNCGLAVAWNPNGTQANVFYVGAPNNQIYNWDGNGSPGGWNNSALGTIPGEPAAPGTGLVAAWQPNGSELDLFYIAAGGQIWKWSWNNSAGAWSNSRLGRLSEPAAPGTGLAGAWQPNATEANVFYVGANGQIYNWFWNGRAWNNSALGTIPGEPAAPDARLALDWHPNGTQANVFYVGASGQIYNWYGNGTPNGWSNSVLGTTPSEPAAPGTGLFAAWQPPSVAPTGILDVFYIAASGPIRQWYGDGSGTRAAWKPLGIGSTPGEPGIPGTGLAGAWQPNTRNANTFYVGASGQIWNWYYGYGGVGETNSALRISPPGEPAAPGTGLALAWQPNGTQVNVFYVGVNGQIWNWYGSGGPGAWSNSQL
jgi:hypothetical protein